MEVSTRRQVSSELPRSGSEGEEIASAKKACNAISGVFFLWGRFAKIPVSKRQVATRVVNGKKLKVQKAVGRWIALNQCLRRASGLGYGEEKDFEEAGSQGDNAGTPCAINVQMA